MAERSAETRFHCGPLGAELTLAACVANQEVPAPFSPCQSCPVGRLHQRELGAQLVSGPLHLPPLRDGGCLACDADAVKLLLCQRHYDQWHRRGRLLLPGAACRSCGGQEARATGLCERCERRRQGARLTGPRARLMGDRFELAGALYQIVEVRLIGRASVLGHDPHRAIVQTPAGLVVGTTSGADL